MKKQFIGMGIGLTLLLGAGVAQGDVIVDTGAGIGGSGKEPALYSGQSAQWLAAEFSLDQNYWITDIHGWLYNNGNTGHNFTITVYGDGGEIPDTNNLLYSNSATITGTDGQANWEGYHISYGNGLELSQGTYWVSFEIRPINYFDPYNGYMPADSPNPLGNEAFLATGNGSWIEYDPLNIGVQILGDPIAPAPVPEPATMLLFGTGIVGLAGSRLKRKKKETK